MSRINLLPWRQRRRRERRRRLVGGLATTAALAALAVALMGLRLADDVDQGRRASQGLTAAIATVDAHLAEIAELERSRDDFAGRAAALGDLWSERKAAVVILDGLADAVVPGVHYTSLTRTGERIVLRGAAQSGDRVAALMRKLREAPLFADPLLKGVTAAENDAPPGDGSARFELSFPWTTPERTQEESP